jgi:hypothetical protein
VFTRSLIVHSKAKALVSMGGHREQHSSSSMRERQMILLSAGVASRRHCAIDGVVPSLAADLDWLALVRTLRGRRLLPTLGPRLVELAQGCADDQFCEAVRLAVEQGRRQGVLLQFVADRVRMTLKRSGIRSSPLKGPMLAEAIYGDLGRRPSADVDLLVDADKLSEAVEIVRSLGYTLLEEHVHGSGLPTLHYALAHQDGELPPVELHWRIHWYERTFARERLLPPPAAPSDWRPEAHDELAALLLFYARDGFVDLRLAADLSAWWDVFGDRLQPERVDELLTRYPALSRTLTAAARVAERIVGIPYERVFSNSSHVRLRERAAVRLANPNPNPRGSVPQLNADMGLVDGLLTPRGQALAFVRRQLLPPRQVLRMRAEGSRERGPVLPLGHCARVLARYGLTVSHLFGTPETARLR